MFLLNEVDDNFQIEMRELYLVYDWILRDGFVIKQYCSDWSSSLIVYY